MIGVVVVTHGQLATELVNAAEMIVGDLPQFAAVSIGWHDDANEKLRAAQDADGGCGGVPFFVNEETGAKICGAVDYETLKAWAEGK